MNSRTCYVVFGGAIFTMASTLLFIGRIPFRATQKLRYPILAYSKNILLILHLIPLFLRFCSVGSNIYNLSYQLPLVIINRSSIYTQINLNPRNILFIFSWKMSGELLTPIGRCLYRYFLL